MFTYHVMPKGKKRRGGLGKGRQEDNTAKMGLPLLSFKNRGRNYYITFERDLVKERALMGKKK